MLEIMKIKLVLYKNHKKSIFKLQFFYKYI
jgi:hypothetical protein